MPEKRCLLVTSAAIKTQIDRLTSQERARTNPAAFLQTLEGRNIEIRASTRAMVQRLLDQKAKSLTYDAVFAAADDLVACCGGDLQHAFEALEVYEILSRKGNKIERESASG